MWQLILKEDSQWVDRLSESKQKLYNSEPSFNVEFPELKFPSNESELPEIFDVMGKYEMTKKTQEEVDKNNIQMMLDIVGEDISDWKQFVKDVDIHTIKLKMKYKRPRPYEITDKLNSINSTDNSPSFPSGHAIESYALAKVLSEKYPEKKDELFETANGIALSRVHMGVHYPSDIDVGEKIGLLIAETYLDKDIKKSWEEILKEWVDCSSCGKGKKRRSCGRKDASKGKKRRCRPTCSACKKYKRRAGKKGKKKKRRKGTFSLEEKYGLHGWFKRRG